MTELNVQKYLRQNGLQALIDNYHVNAKDYPDNGLLVLNYDQIESPKNDPITNECRGLILHCKSFDVVSRSFDRFFNYGECGTNQSIDFSKCYVVEKCDGSLIKIYWYNGEWHISTRGTAFAESGVNGFDVTFSDLVARSLQLGSQTFQEFCTEFLDIDYTYIFEVCCMENRVVTKYDSDKLFILAKRNNETYEYEPLNGIEAALFAKPRQYQFDSIEHCLETVKELPNLEEGYVLYDKFSGTPLCKIKSPAYVAAHALRGEGLNPKRIAQLVLMNEVDEYLSVYPEDAEHFEATQVVYNQLMIDIRELWETSKHLVDQKQFALAVKDHGCSAVLFQAKKAGHDNVDLIQLFHKQTESFQLKAMGVK
jgi:T4 RnlA family RNA ligase